MRQRPAPSGQPAVDAQNSGGAFIYVRNHGFFQKGHQKLVDLGLKVESLAIIESFKNGNITFK